jgi:hypothetical protein
MTQEEKMLLIKDLSARLPYAVTVEHTSGFRGTLHDIAVHHMYDDNDNIYDAICYTDFFGDEDSIYIEYFKPYLFPLSSMTEEQKKEYYSLADDVTIKPGQGSYFGIKIHCIKLGISDNPHEEVWDWIDLDAIDWLNAHHFDYRGLIEKGLAIDATGLNIY